MSEDETQLAKEASICGILECSSIDGCKVCQNVRVNGLYNTEANNADNLIGIAQSNMLLDYSRVRNLVEERTSIA